MTHGSEQSTVFDPETLHILGTAFDDAWQHLEVRVQLNGSGDAVRTILAKHIIAMAKQGERDRQRLIEGALTRLKLEAVSVSGPRSALEGPGSWLRRSSTRPTLGWDILDAQFAV